MTIMRQTSLTRRACLRTLSLLSLGSGAVLLHRIGRAPEAEVEPEEEPSGTVTFPELPEPDWQGIARECTEAIAATHRRDLDAVERGLLGVSEFFERIRPRISPMLDDLFDAGSTVKILWFSGRDQLDGGDRVERYVAQFLSAYLELPDGLGRTFSAFEQELAYALNRHEQELAMSLEAELTPVVEHLDVQGIGRPREAIGRSLGAQTELAAQGQAWLGMGLIALDPGSLVVRQMHAIGPKVLSRLGPRLVASIGVKAGTRAASGAVLAGGAASSWWTAGLSLLASIAITMLIESVVNAVARSWVETQLAEALDLMHREITQSFGSEARRLMGTLRDRRVSQVHQHLARARETCRELT